MSAGDLLIALLRWAHALAAIAWLGGGAYATLVLGPQLAALEDQELVARLRSGTAREFGRLIDASIVVFVVSGVLLTFDRLAGRGASVAYGIVLGLKVGLALWMFAIAQSFNRRGRRPSPEGRFARLRQHLGSPRLLLWLGTIVVLLAALLKALYEAALTS